MAQEVPALEEQLRTLGPVDVVVGVPTYNNARTIEHVLAAIRDGLAKHFGQARCAVVGSDAGSTDATPELFAAAEWELPRVVARHQALPAERLGVPYHGIPGRGAAQRVILDVSRRLEARACVMVAPDDGGIEPDWIDRLLRPVLEGGHDCVAPLCQRRRYDGTLTSTLVYPLVRALYGRRVRQPLGGHLALSGRLIARLAGPETWRGAATRQGIDLWVIATVAEDNLPICEAWLGPCRIEREGRPSDLATIFAQAIGGTFALLEETADGWIDVRGSAPVPVVGTALPLGVEPVEPNIEGMVRAFRSGLKDLVPLWEQVLAPDALAEVLALDSAADDGYRFPHELWARVVYDFALAHRFRVIYRDHLLRCLVPLYLGRTAACVRETSRRPARETEEWIERGCAAFERQKEYLVGRWR